MPLHLPKVVLTKVTPPEPGQRTLVRPRVTQALAQALSYRLTLLQAGAGYGKSTALTVMAKHHHPLVWYQVTEEDSDPLDFLLHICHATRVALPALEDLPIPLLEAWDGARGPLPSTGVIDQYLNVLSSGLEHDTLLVLDDFHLVEGSEIELPLDRLIALAPPRLHIILASRPPVQLPSLSRLRAQGEVLSIDQSILAFKAPEIAALFADHYGYELTPIEAEALATGTEGWAIALQLIWQSLRNGAASSVEDALAHQATSLDSLFEVLAGEVFGGQPPDVQQFMLISATLRKMTEASCDALWLPAGPHAHMGPGAGGISSAAMLAYLRRQELFVIGQGESTLRYHHIFHNFLRQQATPEQRAGWHSQAGEYFRARNQPDEAIYHLLQSADLDAAASLLDAYGAQLIAAGRLDTLSTHLDYFPPETLRLHPALLFHLGDLARLHSRFEEALGWYQQAEALWRERGQMDGVGRALRGQARVYLDTVNPSRAEELLQQALRLSDGVEDRASQARLYELLGENKLNAGKPAEAERLRQQAEALRSEGPSDSQLLFRVLLRTGRLEEARQRLEVHAEAEQREPVHTPRAHRETLLLLSLIYSFQGLAAEALQTAVAGTRRGTDLNSPFITAVGHMRQGHALMLQAHPFISDPVSEAYTLASRQFEKSIELSRTLAVSRLRVEAYWGLCRAYGYQGDLVQAMHMAQEGIEIATQAGDEWIASLVRLALGASLVLAARYEAAEEWLNRAARGFQECSDPFSLCSARLWLCLGWRQQKDTLRLEQNLPALLAECRQRGYDYLFTRTTLLGPPDPRLLVPLLISARDHNWEAGYAARLLKAVGLADINLHPGYQLRVVTLGTFQTWRGAGPVPQNGWRREKARQLFQLLLTYRDAPLDRDQIIEQLWPELDSATAQRNFKVTLNTLYQVLEPGREAGSDSAYILREGTTYGLRPGTDLWLDAQVFAGLVQQAEGLVGSAPGQAIAVLERAVQLYGGEYLPEARYESWAAAEREHLAVLFLRAADRLSELYLQTGRVEEVVSLCQRILACDNCWERAYRHLMIAFDRLGDHGQVARAYQRCLHSLRTELDIAPAAETEALYRKITGHK